MHAAIEIKNANISPPSVADWLLKIVIVTYDMWYKSTKELQNRC